MSFQSMWVHGHSAVIQFEGRGRGWNEDVYGIEWTAVAGLKTETGAIYRCPATPVDQGGVDGFWFHFSIPTPALREFPPRTLVQAKVKAARVLYTTDPGVTLRSVHISDGTDVFYQNDTLSVGGSFIDNNAQEGINLFPVGGLRPVLFGVGISVKFNFLIESNITLHAAGIDFEV